jgi:D-amino-acid dehydrogenase
MGHAVTVIERGAPDHDSCSLGNAGMVTPSHFIPLAAPGMVALGLRMMWNPESPFYIRPRLDPDLLRWAWRFYRASTPEHVARSAPLLRDLSLASRRCFEEFVVERGDDFGLVKKGLLMLCKSAHVLDEEARTAEWARKLGLPAEVLDAAATGRLEPGVRMDVAGSIYFPQDCHLCPKDFVASLTRGLQQSGVRFEWSTSVVGWRASGRKIEAVCTTRGEYSADEFVVAGGSWSPAVAQSLGLKLPMQAGKGYSLTLAHPKKQPTLCAILAEARIAVTPMGSQLRFGGTMELGGMDETINPARIRGIIKAIPAYLPDFSPDDFRDVPAWSGLRPCSPDGLPYIGRFRQFGNLSTATGHAMMGLSLGPITGRLIAELLSDQPASIAIEALSPNRYD